MVLASTDGSSAVLGSVQSAGAIGGVVGALILTAGGEPKKKIRGIRVGWVISGLGLVLMGAGRALPFWLAAHFLVMLVLQLVNAANQAIWQSKVSPSVQGRVFSVRRLIAQATGPIAMAVAGPLADQIFEPALSEGEGWMVRLFRPIFGSGPGAGMSAIIAIGGILVAGVGLGVFQNRRILHVMKLIPNHDEGR